MIAFQSWEEPREEGTVVMTTRGSERGASFPKVAQLAEPRRKARDLDSWFHPLLRSKLSRRGPFSLPPGGEET